MAEIAMGFDFGTTRIGVAVGQRVTGTATALAVVAAQDGIPDWASLDKLVAEWQPWALVVGLPLNMDDTAGDMAAAAGRFAKRLAGRYNICPEMIDERLSTFEAKAFEQPALTDAIAAKLILETWLRS